MGCEEHYEVKVKMGLSHNVVESCRRIYQWNELKYKIEFFLIWTRVNKLITLFYLQNPILNELNKCTKEGFWRIYEKSTNPSPL